MYKYLMIKIGNLYSEEVTRTYLTDFLLNSERLSELEKIADKDGVTSYNFLGYIITIALIS